MNMQMSGQRDSGQRHVLIRVSFVFPFYAAQWVSRIRWITSYFRFYLNEYFFNSFMSITFIPLFEEEKNNLYKIRLSFFFSSFIHFNNRTNLECIFDLINGESVRRQYEVESKAQ